MSIRNVLVPIIVLIAMVGVIAFVIPRGALPQPVACTMEAKLCPDGSAVGRVGPNCEFAACPIIATSTIKGPPVVGAGQHCGGFLQNAPVCAAGLHCQLVVSRPDTGGVCVAGATTGDGGSSLPHDSGINGNVLLGPTCPVMRDPPDPACNDKPYQTTITVSHSSSPARVFARTESAVNGRFRVSLPPGEYVVHANGGTMLPRCGDVSITVESNTYAKVDISCDTGIR